jgi:PIN domain nuclease of toxin-antitoxin system
VNRERLLSWTFLKENLDKHSVQAFLTKSCEEPAIVDEVEARFIVLPISGRACVRALALPATYPKDPADRIIGATAIVEGMSLLTVDYEIRFCVP